MENHFGLSFKNQKVDSKPKLDLLAVSETRLVAQKALLVSTEVDNDECVHTEDSIQPQEFCADEEIMSEVGQMADVEEHSFDDSLT